MQIGYISFCDSTAFNIKSNKVKQKILDNINNLSNIKIIQRHFETFNKNHFKKLNDIPHLVSLKSNGNPYLLFLTKYNFVNLSIFIDKKIQPGYFLPRMIITYFQFDDSLYDNTLLEGEMIKDNNNNWIFIINDVYIYKNKLLNNNNIFNRLDIITDILKNNFNKDDNDICIFNIKKYFKYDKLRYMIDTFSKKLNYTSRGVYFVPLYFKFKNILYNFDDSLINTVKKVKYQKNDNFLLMNNSNITPNTPNTPNIMQNSLNISDIPDISNDISNSTIQIFNVEKTDMPDVFNLYNIDTNKKFDIAYIPNRTTSKFMRNLFKNKTIVTKLKIKCELVIKNETKKWKPIELF